MAAVRVLACLVLVVFAVQLVVAGVSRRDTATSAPSDPISDAVRNFQTLADQLREQAQQLARDSNASAVLEDLANQWNALGTRFNELANHATQQLSNNQAAGSN